MSRFFTISDWSLTSFELGPSAYKSRFGYFVRSGNFAYRCGGHRWADGLDFNDYSIFCFSLDESTGEVVSVAKTTDSPGVGSGGWYYYIREQTGWFATSSKIFKVSGVAYYSGDPYTMVLVPDVISADINRESGLIGSWSTHLSALPVALGACNCLVVGKYVYTFGGGSEHYSLGVPYDYIYRAEIDINGDIGVWSLYGTIPNPGWRLSTAVANGRVYLITYRYVNFEWVTNLYSAQIDVDSDIGPWRLETETGLTNVPVDTQYTGQNLNVLTNGSELNPKFSLRLCYLHAGLSKSIVFDLNESGGIGAIHYDSVVSPEGYKRTGEFFSGGYLYSVCGDGPPDGYGTRTVHSSAVVDTSEGSTVLAEPETPEVEATGFTFAYGANVLAEPPPPLQENSAVNYSGWAICFVNARPKAPEVKARRASSVYAEPLPPSVDATAYTITLANGDARPLTPRVSSYAYCLSLHVVSVLAEPSAPSVEARAFKETTCNVNAYPFPPRVTAKAFIEQYASVLSEPLAPSVYARAVNARGPFIYLHHNRNRKDCYNLSRPTYTDATLAHMRQCSDNH